MIPYSHAQTLSLMLTRSVTIFQHPDSSGVQQLPHERAVGMRRFVCANSHIALVRVDPVEQSLRSHPFHGQATLQQKRDNRTASVSRTILCRADGKTQTQTHSFVSSASSCHDCPDALNCS